MSDESPKDRVQNMLRDLIENIEERSPEIKDMNERIHATDLYQQLWSCLYSAVMIGNDMEDNKMPPDRRFPVWMSDNKFDRDVITGFSAEVFAQILSQANDIEWSLKAATAVAAGDLPPLLSQLAVVMFMTGFTYADRHEALFDSVMKGVLPKEQ